MSAHVTLFFADGVLDVRRHWLDCTVTWLYRHCHIIGPIGSSNTTCHDDERYRHLIAVCIHQHSLFTLSRR